MPAGAGAEAFVTEPVPAYLAGLNTLETIGRPEGTRRAATLQINDLMSIRRAVRRGCDH